MSQGQYEYRIKNWKPKAILRRKENDYLKSRIKELVASRDNWKKISSRKIANQLGLPPKKAARHHYIGVTHYKVM